MATTTATPIRFSDISDELLDLKPQLVKEVVRQLDSHGLAFALWDARHANECDMGDDCSCSPEPEMVGVAWMLFDGLYNSLCIDTLIIRPEHRSLRRLREATALVWMLARAMARVMHAREIVTATRGVRWVERVIQAKTTRRGELISYTMED